MTPWSRTFRAALAAAFLAALACVPMPARAGNNNLTAVADSVKIIRRTHVNQSVQALSGDYVPRNSSGTVVDEGADFGTTTYGWDQAYLNEATFGEDVNGMRVQADDTNVILKFLHTNVTRLGMIAEGFIGGWRAGDIKAHHSFNGTVYCGQGWMLLDGDTVSEANYEADPGKSAGDWAKYVTGVYGTPTLNGKNLPDMDGKYLIGVDATTQTGASPITYTGNASSQISIAHTHTVDAHNHQWYQQNANAHDESYDSGGSEDLFNARTLEGPYEAVVITFQEDHLDDLGDLQAGGLGEDMYTDNQSPGTDSQLSATQSIKPHSLEVQYCMRIVP